jgi:outer membrane protein TolC
MSLTTRFTRLASTLGLLLAVGIAPAAAQAPRLTLDEALRLAAERSEALAAARAGESRADAERMRAGSLRLPQVSFSGAYDRTLASEFSDAFDVSAPVCAPLVVDASRPIAERMAEIERAASCGALGPGFNFGELPFGQRNIYRLTFTVGQALYTGGRITAARRQAELSQQAAGLATTAALAQLLLDVTRAFFDAALTDRLLAIAEASLAQAGAAHEQARLAFGAGRQPEFELLRAQVSRDNLRPAVIRRRADRDIAYLRLRQLLELPADAPLLLDVDLESDALPPPAPFAATLAETAGAALDAADRAPVRQAAALVGVREAGVAIARADRLPQVSFNSTYGRVGYPSEGAWPGWDDFRTNWSLGAAVSVPLFTGARLRAGELSARADLAEAEAVLEQTRELAELDAAVARQDLGAAAAVWDASAGTVQQAQRAYEIAELRYREGVSTQLELSDARLALEQARANRAQSARDLQVARARVALLPGLPVR